MAASAKSEKSTRVGLMDTSRNATHHKKCRAAHRIERNQNLSQRWMRDESKRVSFYLVLVRRWFGKNLISLHRQ